MVVVGILYLFLPLLKQNLYLHAVYSVYFILESCTLHHRYNWILIVFSNHVFFFPFLVFLYFLNCRFWIEIMVIVLIALQMCKIYNVLYFQALYCGIIHSFVTVLVGKHKTPFTIKKSEVKFLGDDLSDDPVEESDLTNPFALLYLNHIDTCCVLGRVILLVSICCYRIVVTSDSRIGLTLPLDYDPH